MKHLTLVISLLTCLSFTACNSSKEVQNEEVVVLDASTEAEVETREEPEVYFSMRRSPCFGTCPVYRLTIFKNGQVTYVGQMNVEKMGTYTSKLTEQQMNAIAKKAIQINYFGMEDEYPTGDVRISDMPSTISFLDYDGQTKEIVNRNYSNPKIPEEADVVKKLQEFEKMIDEMLEAVEWGQMHDIEH